MTLSKKLCSLLLLSSLAACTTPNQTYREEGVRLYNEAKVLEAANDSEGAGVKYRAALADFEKSLEDKSTDPISNAYKGAIHYRAGEYEIAAYHAHVALQFDPSNTEARTVLIASRIKQGKADLALDALERLSALADKTKDPRPAMSNWKTPDSKEIEARLFYSTVSNRYEIGRVYENLGDLDNAALWYNRALEKKPDHAPSLLALVKLYDRAGNRPKLITAVQNAYAAIPANPELITIMTRNQIAISAVSPPAP